MQLADAPGDEPLEPFVENAHHEPGTEGQYQRRGIAPMPPDAIEQVGDHAVLDEMELLDEILVRVAGACGAPVRTRNHEGGREAEIAAVAALPDPRDGGNDCCAGGADDDGADDCAVLTGQRLLEAPTDLTDVRRAQNDGERRHDGEQQFTPHHARCDMTPACATRKNAAHYKPRTAVVGGKTSAKRR